MGPFLHDDLEIKLDSTCRLPAWIQITSIIAGQVSRRRIKVGEYIWSIRQVAQFNRLNARTVAKAYEMMLKKGIIENVPQKGFRVGKQILTERNKILRLQLQDTQVMARQMEIDLDSVKLTL